MKAAGTQHFSSRARATSLGIVAVAFLLAVGVYFYNVSRPATDDASIDADVVHVAPAVSGRVIAIGVSENSRVRRGALLIQIDPEPYRLAVAQAEADLAIAQAELSTRRRILFTARANAVVAADQSHNARMTSGLATRTADRLRPLAASGFVPNLQLDQAEVAARNAVTAVHQASELQAAAYELIDTEAAAEAVVRARAAALGIARRGLADTTVRAVHDGLVVGLAVSSGEFVLPGQALFTLINTEQWYAVANFRETDLDEMARGDCATVYSMAARSEPMKGAIEGIGWGVFDTERINIPRSEPYVERSLNWVRVAQRFPVRIRLQHPPRDAVRVGASAIVEVKHGVECR